MEMKRSSRKLLTYQRLLEQCGKRLYPKFDEAIKQRLPSFREQIIEANGLSSLEQTLGACSLHLLTVPAVTSDCFSSPSTAKGIPWLLTMDAGAAMSRS